MSSVPSKDIIFREFLPFTPRPKAGKSPSDELYAGIWQLILFRLKTGTQWRELPVKQYIDQKYSWKSVFYHFTKWSKMGVFKQLWQDNLQTGKLRLQLRTAQLDGSHTACFRGGEAVGYQGRKRCKTCNMLYISDEQGLILAASDPKSGNHHDVHQIKKSFRELIEQLEDLGLSLDGLIINADSGFDSQELRTLCQERGIECNFDLNPRKGQKSEREDYFNEEFYKARFVIERTFAWLDAFKALLVRYETTVRNWLAVNHLAFFLIAMRKMKKL